MRLRMGALPGLFLTFQPESSYFFNKPALVFKNQVTAALTDDIAELTAEANLEFDHFLLTVQRWQPLGITKGLAPFLEVTDKTGVNLLDSSLDRSSRFWMNSFILSRIFSAPSSWSSSSWANKGAADRNNQPSMSKIFFMVKNFSFLNSTIHHRHPHCFPASRPGRTGCLYQKYL